MGTMRMLAIAGAMAAACTGAWGQQLYKCTGGYQDRPCADAGVQKRYAAGRFDVEQVNPDTDKDCARLVGETMPYWTRLRAGETVEALRAEYDRQPVAKADKSAMRDLFIHLAGVQGTPVQARAELERQCMNYKVRKGLPTERELDAARTPGSSGSSRPYAYRVR